MKMQRLTAFLLTAALALPMSAAAENRARQGTDMERLAADLARVLGHDRVETNRPAATARTTSAMTAEEAIVAEMNRERAAHGLQPLRLNTRLSLAASDRVGDMLEKRYFAHVAPDGTDPFVWAGRRGYDFRTMGENLAVGFRTAGSIVGGWMGSPGHRANILGRSFDEVGVAVASSSPRREFRGLSMVAL